MGLNRHDAMVDDASYVDDDAAADLDEAGEGDSLAVVDAHQLGRDPDHRGDWGRGQLRQMLNQLSTLLQQRK